MELDPGFALAWAGVARTHVWLAAFSTEGGQKTFDAHLSSARDAVTRALAIEPNLPEALLARGSIETNFDFNWNGAAQTLSNALALAPADPSIVIAASNLEIARGNMDRAIELYRKAVDLTRSTHKHEHFSPLTWQRRSGSQKRAPNIRAWWS